MGSINATVLPAMKIQWSLVNWNLDKWNWLIAILTTKGSYSCYPREIISSTIFKEHIVNYLLYFDIIIVIATILCLYY